MRTRSRNYFFIFDKIGQTAYGARDIAFMTANISLKIKKNRSEEDLIELVRISDWTSALYFHCSDENGEIKLRSRVQALGEIDGSVDFFLQS